MTLELRPVAPFDLAWSLAFLRGFGPMRGDQEISASHVTKAIRARGRPFVFRASQTTDRERPALAVDVLGEGPRDPADDAEVLARVADVLTTAEDLAPFYARAAEDPALAPLVRRLRGLHHPKFPSAFEAACWAVINQRVGLAAARAMKSALTRRAGHALVVDGVTHWAFPEPDAVLRLAPAELARLLPGRRAKSVEAVARAFAGVPPHFLRDAPLDDVRAWLRAIHGVGPFTTSFVLYRALGRFDGAAVISPKLVSAAARVHARQMTERDVRARIDAYGAWGGHWMLYVWASGFL